jgi:hypothetical protein
VALLASGCSKDLVRRLLLAFGAVPALAVEIANVFAALEFRLQQFDRAADYAALQLHKTSIKGDAAVHGREEAECSFAPNVWGLNCRAILQTVSSES